jgi:hypothetical protein
VRYPSLIFRSTLYKWWQIKYWCWKNKAITTVRVDTDKTNVDPTVTYKGISKSTSYYNYALGNSKGEHYSMRQAYMAHWWPSQLGGGSMSSYPWVRITTRGNGTWTASWGR